MIGTFLGGKCYLGKTSYPAGRHLRDSAETEAPSIGLSNTLARLEFPLGRLKTGTPARLDGRTIKWDILEPQPSDDPPNPFSYMNAYKGVALKDRLIEVGRKEGGGENWSVFPLYNASIVSGSDLCLYSDKHICALLFFSSAARRSLIQEPIIW